MPPTLSSSHSLTLRSDLRLLTQRLHQLSRLHHREMRLLKGFYDDFQRSIDKIRPGDDLARRLDARQRCAKLMAAERAWFERRSAALVRAIKFRKEIIRKVELARDARVQEVLRERAIEEKRKEAAEKAVEGVAGKGRKTTEKGRGAAKKEGAREKKKKEDAEEGKQAEGDEEVMDWVIEKWYGAPVV